MSYRKGRVIDPPKRIFLCYGPLEGEDITHEDAYASGDEGVLWCTDKIDDGDVEYRLVKPSKHKRRASTKGASHD